MKQSQIFLLPGLVLVGVGANANDGGKAKAMPCTACHGVDGNSTLNPEWPNLAGQHQHYLVTQLRAFKSGVRKNPNMSGMVATLADEDMAEIADFFANQSVKVQSIDAMMATAGATLYRGGNKATGVPACMACHGPNGAGNPAAVFPALRGQHSKYTVNQLTAYRNAERTTDPKEIMRTIAARMTPTEIDSVAKFIEGLH